MKKDAIQDWARTVIGLEANAVTSLLDRIDEHFFEACAALLDCKGRIVVIGMGKSGHVGNKIAATLASTGTAAFFVHPAEASHGDLGMIKPVDVVLALSNSGETDEVNMILPVLKRLGVGAETPGCKVDCHDRQRCFHSGSSRGYPPRCQRGRRSLPVGPGAHFQYNCRPGHG
jgi:hypothetical protein